MVPGDESDDGGGGDDDAGGDDDDGNLTSLSSLSDACETTLATSSSTLFALSRFSWATRFCTCFSMLCLRACIFSLLCP